MGIVPIDQLADAMADTTKPVMTRILTLLYTDRFYGAGANVPVAPEVIADTLDIPLSDVNTAIEALQVRGLVVAEDVS